MANEVVLNALLWVILKANGIVSQAEERNADGSKTDIRCTIGDYTVAVEAVISLFPKNSCCVVWLYAITHHVVS